VIVVVGASREDRQDALNGLLRLLLIVGPIALVVVSGAGYLVAAGALRPVEQMREQAESISDETSGARLTLTRARDEIRRLGQTLNDMLARLESGRARERRFIADASHELRTPLALLRTELDLALRKPRSPDELRAALLSAADEVERLVMLSEDLLVLAAADERGIRLDRTDVPIADLIDAAVRRFSSRAAEDGRAFDTSIEPRGVTISADRLRLEQALGNLVDNALRHGDGTVTLRAEVSPAASPAGDSDGAVAHRGEITAAQGGSRVWLSVRDHGRGFPRDFLPHAFERFSRADAARTTGSAGLGLAIAEMIARAHGGGACAENAPDGGAIVSVWLPRDSS
jgi:signal transduction histidine kinase